MTVYVCKCGHHGFEHSGGVGSCTHSTLKRHPSDKNLHPIRKECACSEFKPTTTLAEHMSRVNAA